jgi:peroxidase
VYRFWYESSATFTPDQLAELKKQSLARVLCDSGENFTNAPPDAFRVTSLGDTLPCAQINGMNLSVWQE